ncbi:bifunctional phosphopantothenoylcysteine decarboxylase/phosphopantothenate--cysteine ligase CoaBC [Schinkia azotoformans]|uniref:Coenzyme A biosynthesis bifunctional protein CoaBC n=1 Tax=Schinkia azotoformans LMG 9581 TaxID=1131731 RepID=K6D6X8_SCHAZ|nr:bifunctional phosphopantothenoylcysteine decarboxylase/phosphopantothenate--cysteine ligase CoaBC [Schinkia azotoformans]EKN63828.1 phosphopantothenoylcysteine decarboxylase/phosphopantothenate--cysteine ligase [Schinkia azotoformans LMG 9581]MEC1638302.1 bifunctional phosphopantothenoylcysteine decarboxylase/phosphopantothenate--cysteine ligase CoaBC [Schinkia azotoformans]MEC1946264.1 bifunctional phosphopantothenoylcysteine decarboxylase/phosphopantothenate--cysteine ligase CoaBC [Schinkia
MNGKKILLCVSGGIAAYKAAALTSKLTQTGAIVKVIMTESATKFVQPLTFQALSRNDVFFDTFDEKDSGKIAHIDLADWADIVIVAPATANVIGKLANGIADDMVTTTLLATTAPVWIAPAMNVHMYDHPAVKQNINKLYSYGYKFIEPTEGQLACGYVGKGRLEEPERIVDLVNNHFSENFSSLKGKKILVTAGPTKEVIDPVRFLTNRSSGKMGYAIAEAANNFGANVTLVSGPTTLTPPANVNFVQIESAQEMYEQVMNYYHDTDIVIKAAAVADYRPATKYEQKMKKKDGDLIIQLERTIDILKTLGERKEKQILVGFAAETENVQAYAEKKLKSKNLDMIVANNVTQEGAGFGVDTNILTIYTKQGEKLELPLLSKQEAAKEILKKAATFLK